MQAGPESVPASLEPPLEELLDPPEDDEEEEDEEEEDDDEPEDEPEDPDAPDDDDALDAPDDDPDVPDDDPDEPDDETPDDPPDDEPLVPDDELDPDDDETPDDEPLVKLPSSCEPPRPPSSLLPAESSPHAGKHAAKRPRTTRLGDILMRRECTCSRSRCSRVCHLRARASVYARRYSSHAVRLITLMLGTQEKARSDAELWRRSGLASRASRPSRKASAPSDMRPPIGPAKRGPRGLGTA